MRRIERYATFQELLGEQPATVPFPEAGEIGLAAIGEMITNFGRSDPAFAALNSGEHGTAFAALRADVAACIYARYLHSRVNVLTKNEDGTLIEANVKRWWDGFQIGMWGVATSISNVFHTILARTNAITDDGHVTTREGFAAPNGAVDTTYQTGAERVTVSRDYANAAVRAREVAELPALLSPVFAALDRYFLGVIDCED